MRLNFISKIFWSYFYRNIPLSFSNFIVYDSQRMPL
nr:MAG TPA: hypothetical protein [Caudoviricetes sp.]